MSQNPLGLLKIPKNQPVISWESIPGVDVAKVWEISTGLCRGAEISFAAGGWVVRVFWGIFNVPSSEKDGPSIRVSKYIYIYSLLIFYGPDFFWLKTHHPSRETFPCLISPVWVFRLRLHWRWGACTLQGHKDWVGDLGDLEVWMDGHPPCSSNRSKGTYC